MRLSYVSTPSSKEVVSESFRTIPEVHRVCAGNWRDLTYDSSIQILEMEETLPSGQNTYSKTTKEVDETIDSISEYGAEVFQRVNMEREYRSLREFTRSRDVTSSINDIRTSDILGNTLDDQKNDRPMSCLRHASNVNSNSYLNKSNLGDCVNLCSKYQNVTYGKNTHLQRKSHSDSILYSNKTGENQIEALRTGRDVCTRPKNRNDSALTRARRMTAPTVHEEPIFVQPLQPIKYESKVGPVKKVKLRTIHREARERKLRRYGCMKGNTYSIPFSVESTVGTPYTLNPTLPEIMTTSFRSLAKDQGSLSDFLLENETIPAINSATPIGNCRTNECGNHAGANLTQTPSLRESRKRSMATSDLRHVQCKRSLDFNGSFEHNGDISSILDTHHPHYYNEYETVLNLCTRKPRLGVTIKSNDKPMVLNKDAINEIKMAISISSKRMAIKTNGTINVLPKITKATTTHASKSPRRKGIFTPSSRRNFGTNSLSNPCRSQAVFESTV